MKKLFLITVFFVFVLTDMLNAQTKMFTRTGKIVFFSKAPLEDIKAVNNQVNCIYEVESNKIVAKVLIKAFEFDKALMQKHFNENYMESDKFPKATFKGKILNPGQLNLKEDWVKNIEFEGDLTVHGVTKKLRNAAQIIMEKGKLNIKAEFYIHLKDYDIKIPSTVINNVAEKVKIDITLVMDELKN